MIGDNIAIIGTKLSLIFHLVNNPNAVKPIEDTANTENAIEERYLYDLYKNLEKAEQDKDEAAQLKAFKALQNYYISQATTTAIMQLSIDHKKPIGNGIITSLNIKQALIRSKKKGGEAARAVVSVLSQFVICLINFLANDDCLPKGGFPIKCNLL